MLIDKFVEPEEYYSWGLQKKVDYEKNLSSEEKVLFNFKRKIWNIKNSFGIELNTHEKWALRSYIKLLDPQDITSTFMRDYFGFSVQEFYFNIEEDIFKHPKFKDYLKEKSKLWRDERELI